MDQVDKVRWVASLSLGTLETLAILHSSARADYEGEKNQTCNLGAGNSHRGQPTHPGSSQPKGGG